MSLGCAQALGRHQVRSRRGSEDGSEAAEEDPTGAALPEADDSVDLTETYKRMPAGRTRLTRLGLFTSRQSNSPPTHRAARVHAGEPTRFQHILLEPFSDL